MYLTVICDKNHHLSTSKCTKEKLTDPDVNPSSKTISIKNKICSNKYHAPGGGGEGGPYE